MNIVLVGYTSEKTLAAIRFCDAAFPRESFPNRVLVCNKSALVDPADQPEWSVLQGSNEFGEFSGWQEGLNYLRSLDDSPKATLFANDTLTVHRRFSWFRKWSLVREISRAPPRSIVGFVDHADNDIGDLTITGLQLAGWVSTFCFLLGTEALHRLDYKLYSPEVVQRCVPGGPVESEFFSDALSSDLRAHLSRWLFGGGWYQSKPLSEHNSQFFTKKARLICAEWLLSARCWNAGCARRDPFERHPLAAFLDWKTEKLMRRLRLGTSAWLKHPENWSAKNAGVGTKP